jgi:hypothetical protein
MNAIQIVQEAARRLMVIIPQAPLFPASTDDSSAIDYDKNLMCSCLQATVNQNMVLFFFNRQNYIKNVTLTYNANVKFLDNHTDRNPIYRDFVFNLLGECPDVEQIVGDGINVSVFPTDEKTIYKSKQYIFRQFTAQDMLRLKKSCISPTPFQNTPVPTPPIPEYTAMKERRDYKKNFPSEDRSPILTADNKDSGFFLMGDYMGNKIIYFVNNLISDAEVNAAFVTWEQPPIIEFLYRSNYGIINQLNGRVPVVTDDTDTFVLPDELLILGIMVQYKTWYGMDVTIELGQYKAMIDQMKQNQEVIQATHLDRKSYHQPKR